MSEKSPEQISEEILNSADFLKLRNNTVVVSNIVTRDDLQKKKAQDIGNLLEKLCKDNSIEAISHRSINTKRHLNTGKLRFINSGVSIFLRSFRSFLSTFDEIGS